VAVGHGLEVDLPRPFEDVDEGGIDGDHGGGVWRLDVTLAELRAKALEQPDLLLREGELALALGRGRIQLQQPFVPGPEAVALPDATYAAGGHLDALSTSSSATRIGPWQGWASA